MVYLFCGKRAVLNALEKELHYGRKYHVYTTSGVLSPIIHIVEINVGVKK